MQQLIFILALLSVSPAFAQQTDIDKAHASCIQHRQQYFYKTATWVFAQGWEKCEQIEKMWADQQNSQAAKEKADKDLIEKLIGEKQ